MKILVKAVAGSHLFGTNTPQSDQDFKGVFLPTADDILLGKFDQTIHHSTGKDGMKNTKDDVDTEFYSLDKFLKMLYQGQTVAWELLFTPDELILEKHPLWDEIRAEAPKLVNKKVDAFIGYCKQQANKYGVRGSRMNTLETVLKILKSYPSHLKLGIIDWKELIKLEHVEMLPDKNGKMLLHICGKKFENNTSLQYVVAPLQKYYEEYGERSRKAKENEGIDWKALSHALRVCIQACELLETGKLQFPIKRRYLSYLKAVKAGKIDFGYVQDDLELFMDRILRRQQRSKLPDQPNLEAFQAIQKHIYGMIVKGEV